MDEVQKLKETLSDIQGCFRKLAKASNPAHKLHWTKQGGSLTASALAIVKRLGNDIKEVVEQPAETGVEGH